MENLLFDFISRYIDINDEEKQTLKDLNIFHTIPKRTVLLEQGKKSQNGFFVLKGCIRTYYIVEGEEKTTAFYTEMEGHTPICLKSKAPSEYCIETVEDSIITISTPEMESQIFTKFPKFETLCRVLSEDLLVKEQLNFDDFKISSPEQRYIKLRQQRPDLLQRAPQHQIASFLGITPQSLSRLRSRLAKKEN
ncbi:MAG: Crp/Fnr family transcriptional regulator [Flavobacteriales bacterium]|nr:Crp/Fnr family transcriptional regulator [Flavobacteriales bacterium]